MKIKNIFKKENKSIAKVNVEKLEKNQLEKVIGGGNGTLTADLSAENGLKTKHDTAKNSVSNIR